MRSVCGQQIELNYQTPGVLPYELSVQPYTSITIGESFLSENELPTVKDVAISDIAQATGTVRKCYIIYI